MFEADVPVRNEYDIEWFIYRENNGKVLQAEVSLRGLGKFRLRKIQSKICECWLVEGSQGSFWNKDLGGTPQPMRLPFAWDCPKPPGLRLPFFLQS